MSITQLINKLNEAIKAYYSGEEIISDKEFDALYSKLQALERERGIAFPNSPTQKVGSKTAVGLPKIRHEYRALSLDSTKDPEELANWLNGYLGVLSWKLDGLTVILTYDNGKLVQAATRGDGELGEDIFHNAFYFAGVPITIEDKSHIVVRGEAVITFNTFETINEDLPAGKKYKNPRSMAAGAIRFLDSERSAKYNVQFIPFELVNAGSLEFTSVSDSLHYLYRSLGMNPVEHWTVTKESLADVITCKKDEVNSLPYATDGLVLVYNDLYLHNQLGATQKFPKYAKAFKWEDETATTILRDVDWSVSKVGLINPIAIFDPVELNGTTVRRASVHNITIMHELGLGIGDHISVYKANMIIPQIHECVEKSNDVYIPVECPVCGGNTELRLGVNNKSEFLYCLNEDCVAKQ